MAGKGTRNNMADTVEALILDLLDWLMVRERTCEEAIAAWRTSRPRLPVWEDASDRGLIAREEIGGRCVVRVTLSGRELLGRLGDGRERQFLSG
jgi:hypothetical protein